MAAPEDQRFRHGTALLRCFDELRATLSQRLPPVVDCEVIPHFDGRAEGLFLWLLCDRESDVAVLNSQLLELTVLVRAEMRRQGFTERAAETLQTGAASLEAIAFAGGRFAYFR